MKTYTNLNQNEISVLKAIALSSEGNGGDFTYFEDVIEELEISLTKEQVKGYFSQLEKKKYIGICEGQICAAGDADYLTDYEF
jgi:hypothetical protein